MNPSGGVAAGWALRLRPFRMPYRSVEAQHPARFLPVFRHFLVWVDGLPLTHAQN
jgi:hypothetical protein